MEDKRWYAAPNLINICVDRIQDQDIAGRIYHVCADEPVHFSSAGNMMIQIDTLCDRMGYPQAAVVARSFKGRSHAEKKKEGGAANMRKPEEILKQNGEEATFVLHIKYRQNATWQGSVTWAEENVRRDFRSALELLKLIDSALDGKQILKEETEQQGP